MMFLIIIIVIIISIGLGTTCSANEIEIRDRDIDARTMICDGTMNFFILFLFFSSSETREGDSVAGTITLDERS